jgi:peptidoglycan L-alanyl-D-glutamate endopeptidase CwlK
MGKDLSELTSYFRPLAEQLIARCSAAGVPVRIIDTGRTEQEQVAKISQGVSWVARSKHEPQPPENLSEAIDIVPLTILSENKLDWDPSNPEWQTIGQIGKAMGLRWGGDWPKKDMGHFEYVHGAKNPPMVMTT